MQPYLISKNITTRQKKVIFRFRTKMVNVGHNYGRKLKCSLCKLEDDTQEHLFNCLILKLSCPELYNSIDEKYEDIFSLNHEKITNVARICEQLIRKREELLT